MLLSNNFQNIIDNQQNNIFQERSINMFPNVWTQNDYDDYLKYLETLYDEKNKIFFTKTCTTKYEVLGIKLPILRKIAVSISKTDIRSFLSFTEYKYYEEVMIKGFVIARIKDEKEFLTYFNSYINYIDCWGLCDSFCNSLKIVRTNSQKFFKVATKLALQKKEYHSRVGLCIILFHFVEEPYFTRIYDILNQITSDKYYINMAESWLICELYIKNKEQTLDFLKSNNLNKFTHNKAISKIKDSYRVTKTEKNYLNTLKKQ